MKHTRPRQKGPLTWLTVTVLLLAAIGAAFWVPLYARSQPKLGPFPFFYWYQLMLVPVIAVAAWLCYLMLRPARQKQPPGAPAAPGGSPRQEREDAR
jgi:cytochrome bd-type quinol oxidase subunit 2